MEKIDRSEDAKNGYSPKCGALRKIARGFADFFTIPEKEDIPPIPTEKYSIDKIKIGELLKRIIDANRTNFFGKFCKCPDRLGVVMAFDGIDHDELRDMLPSLRKFIYEVRDRVSASGNSTGGTLIGPTQLASDLDLILELVERELAEEPAPAKPEWAA